MNDQSTENGLEVKPPLQLLWTYGETENKTELYGYSIVENVNKPNLFTVSQILPEGFKPQPTREFTTVNQAIKYVERSASIDFSLTACRIRNAEHDLNERINSAVKNNEWDKVEQLCNNAETLGFTPPENMSVSEYVNTLKAKKNLDENAGM